MKQQPRSGSSEVTDGPDDPAGDLKIALLEHIYGDDPEAHVASLAERVANDELALSYLVQLFDDTCALHDRARSKLAEATPPVLVSLERIDMLLDDVMILLSHREGTPSGGELEALEERSVPVGEGERA